MSKVDRDQANRHSNSKSSLGNTVFWRIAENIPQSLSWILISLSIIFPLATWFLTAQYAGIDSIFLPSPADVIEAMVDYGLKGI